MNWWIEEFVVSFFDVRKKFDEVSLTFSTYLKQQFHEIFEANESNSTSFHMKTIYFKSLNFLSAFPYQLPGLNTPDQKIQKYEIILQPFKEVLEKKY